MNRRKTPSWCVAATWLALTGTPSWCAGAGDTHTVGGTLEGLRGRGLVLRLGTQSTAAAEVRPPPGAVRFAFAPGLPSGAAYAVTVQAQPVDPVQHCVVTHGQGGRIGVADVADVQVDCNGAPDSPARASLDPRLPHAWDIYLDRFQVDVEIQNISFSDGYCSVAGGTVNAKFRESPGTHGKPVGTITWNPDRSSTSVSIWFDIDSDSTVGPQSGQSSPGSPVSCEATSHHFEKNSYRLDGELRALTGNASFTSPMPRNDDTAGNVGCPPEGNSCHVQFWFDNSPGTARTSLDIATLLSTGSVVVPIRGSARNVASTGETRSGDFSWAGTMTLRTGRP